MALFEAHNIQKRFGDRVVLENIDLKFEANQLSGIMGPNGAGKSTCFNVITGVYKPDRGNVLFDGEDITGLPERLIVRKGISRSFQTINVFDDYTVLENIALSSPLLRRQGFNFFHNVANDRELFEEGMETLKKIGLEDIANARAKNLPYGIRRALEIGIAFSAKPKILFLDEPTQGLGADQRATLATFISDLKQYTTIVIIEHDMNFLFSLADNIFVIHWGQVISEGTPEELRENKWVKSSSLMETE